MTTEQIIQYLRTYNEWRRGNDAPQPDPAKVGKVIDAACDALEEAARMPKRFASVRDLVKATAADDEQIREFDRRIEEARSEGDRPTPETDLLQSETWKPNWAAHARKLERERDEARKLADQWRQESNWAGNESTYRFPWE